MGGLLILGSILIPTLLFAKIDNIYVLLMILSTVWLGAIGFLDDYIKVFKKDKEGLKGKFKIIGQVGLGLIVGATLFFNESVVIKREISADTFGNYPPDKVSVVQDHTGTFHYLLEQKVAITSIPFVKTHEFNYGKILQIVTDNPDKWAWLIYIPIVIFIITAVSNGANITDGIDGLAAGTSVIIGLTLAVLAYVSGNKVFSQYLNVMFIPNSGELAVFCAAFVGACIGFLWYNAYPAQVFMGDTGSLMLGGVIATLAIVIRKEMLIPVLCGIFLIENMSVIIQVAYFKYTKRKYGEGRRVFLMSPLHHHFQKKNYHESKIVIRFLIVGIILAVISLVTLKLR
jgi:phospho-N-acetylmuramoyl-pentapeptide-transferase